DRQMEERVAQFCGITGASTTNARRFIEKFRGLEPALNAYYNDPNALSSQRGTPGASTSKLADLFNKYKDPDGEDIGVDGTIKFCEDLSVNPEDVVLLAVAYELKSPRMGEWSRKGWVDGWKALGCAASALDRLRLQLAQDPQYFQQVYNYTFEFSRPQGQRSLGLDMAQAFWALLIPHGLQGGALAHVNTPNDDGDEEMDDGEGWKPQYLEWWFEFLNEKGGKGVSKDTWQMFLEFVRTIDARFQKYDTEAAWPSTLDDFVEYARGRLGAS
ncbi:hypothetical protein CERSUDRAFT_60717, partial [Gelatoporia subvermispora B]